MNTSPIAALERTEARLTGMLDSRDCRVETGRACSCWKCDLERVRQALTTRETMR